MEVHYPGNAVPPQGLRGPPLPDVSADEKRPTYSSPDSTVIVTAASIAHSSTSSGPSG